MLDLPLFLAFVTTATVITMTPGIDTATVLRSATVEGPRAAVLASIGIAFGCLIWGGAVALGLGALLHASEVAYTMVKYVGAAYLFWLGIKLLSKARGTLCETGNQGEGPNHPGAFYRGLLTNLLNPKVGVFYVTFLPQFVPSGTRVASYTFFLAAVHIVVSVVWFAVLIVAAMPLGRLLRRPRATRILDRTTGVIFVAFGLKLATSSAR